MTITVSRYTATVLILENYGTASLETNSTETQAIITAHGLDTGDFIVNTTRRALTYMQAERGSRKVNVESANTLSHYAIAGQTQNDIVTLFKFIDRTSYLLDGTLGISLRAEGQNEAMFTINYTNTINDNVISFLPGQYIKIKLNNELKFGGIIDNTSRRKEQTVIKKDVNCVGYNNIPSRRTIELDYDYDTTSSVVVNDMIDYLIQDGITTGSVSTGIILEDEWKNEVISISDVLDECSNRNGFQWFIDKDMKLNFLQEVTISDCTYTIVTGGTFSDYRDVVISDTINNYSNKVFVIGGNDDHGDVIWVNNADLDEQNDMQDICGGTGVYGIVNSDGAIVGHEYIIIGANSSPSVISWSTNSFEIGDWFWNITRNAKGYITATGSTTVACTTISGQTVGDEIEVYKEANIVGRNTLKKQKIINETIEFKTFTIDFLPQTKLTVSISDLSCSGVYNIEEVNIQERQACYFEATVKAVKKVSTDFSTQKSANYVDFFKNF